MNLHFKTIIFSLLLISVLLFTGPSLGMPNEELFIPKEGIFADPYVSVLEELFDRWDDGELILKKAQLEPIFEEKLKQRMETRPFGYEDEYWQNEMLKRWVQLPEVLKPYLKLSLGSRLYLIGLYVDNLDDFGTNVPIEQAESQLRLPLFIILGTAQPPARKIEAQTIITWFIRRAIDLFYTNIYPFCSSKPPE